MKPATSFPRLPLLAIDACGSPLGQEARRIEGVDRHVEEEDVPHRLAEPAEMRRDEEVAVDAGRRADRAEIEKAPDAPDIGDVAAVLHHRVAPLRPRAASTIARAFSRLSASGFSVKR